MAVSVFESRREKAENNFFSFFFRGVVRGCRHGRRFFQEKRYGTVSSQNPCGDHGGFVAVHAGGGRVSQPFQRDAVQNLRYFARFERNACRFRRVCRRTLCFVADHDGRRRNRKHSAFAEFRFDTRTRIPHRQGFGRSRPDA